MQSVQINVHVAPVCVCVWERESEREWVCVCGKGIAKTWQVTDFLPVYLFPTLSLLAPLSLSPAAPDLKERAAVFSQKKSQFRFIFKRLFTDSWACSNFVFS